MEENLNEHVEEQNIDLPESSEEEVQYEAQDSLENSADLQEDEEEVRDDPLASENAELKRKLEQYEQAQRTQPQQTYQSVPADFETKLYQQYQSDLDAHGPLEALRLQQVYRERHNTLSKWYQDTANLYVNAKNGQVKGMEHFKEVEDNFQYIANEYGFLLDQTAQYHPKAMEAIYYMAVGKSLDRFLNKATNGATKLKAAKQGQKKRAMLEGSESLGESVEFNELTPQQVDRMPLSELRKMLGVRE